MKDSFVLNRPGYLLQAEGLVTLITVCIAYASLYPSRWGLFALLFLFPDISLFAFIGGNDRTRVRPVAAAFYNLLHTYVLPLIQAVFAWKYHSVPNGEIALIWMAHISFDRLLGYGLKFPGSFKRTHIQTAASL